MNETVHSNLPNMVKTIFYGQYMVETIFYGQY